MRLTDRNKVREVIGAGEANVTDLSLHNRGKHVPATPPLPKNTIVA